MPHAPISRPGSVASKLAALGVALALLPAPTPLAADSTDDGGDPGAQWLRSMVEVHGYTLEEVAAATGLPAAQAADRLRANGLEPGDGAAAPSPRAADGRLRVLPYPGGRHPRIGFLDGAIDPWRETKLSVLLPWKGAGYAVLDLPEALWESGRLWFLAHQHIPTVWDEKGVELVRRDWETTPDGSIRNRFWLPDGASIVATARPGKEVVELSLRLRNGTDRRLTGLRTQVCVMLKGAPEFNALTGENKLLEPRTGPPATKAAAVRTAGGDRWIVTLWTRAGPWGNDKVPCLHADPVFPDLAPGEEATLHGRVFFHEGPGLEAALESHRASLAALDTSPHPAPPRLHSARRIWSAKPHSAFTDLIRFGGQWLCSFREGKGHVSPDGALRIIGSEDGQVWRPLSRLTSPTADLRDPKLCILPDGRLHISGAAALHPPSPHRHQTFAWTSKDGRTWSEPTAIGDPDRWLWRLDWVTPDSGPPFGLSAGYGTAGERSIRLYGTDDGLRFRTLVDRLSAPGEANDTSFAQLPDGDVLCVARRDAAPATALLGRTRAPYTQWIWRDLGVRVGGPKLLRLPDGRLILGCRLYDGGARTSLCRLDPDAGRLEEILRLPSGGDTSYPGLVWEEGHLWVSYYSSHLERTSIWLARVEL